MYASCQKISCKTLEVSFCVIGQKFSPLSNPHCMLKKIRPTYTVYIIGDLGFLAVLRIRIHMFLGLLDPDPDPSIIMTFYL